MLPQSSPAAFPRRHDLDWLRVIAFGFLIFYHIGMFYVTWDWHVKSGHASGAIEPIMALINPWRLPLLFFISGVALRFAMDKTMTRAFLPRRAGRLLLPIAFGFFVWVMPQAYFELLAKGEIGPDLWAFYRDYLDVDFEFSILTPTYNHLWYLVYILLYTLVVAALLPLLRRLERPTETLLAWLSASAFGWRLLLLPTAPFLIYAATLVPYFPTTHAVVDDWANHANLLTILLIGWLTAKSPVFWAGVVRALRPAVLLALTLGAALLAARLNWDAVRDAEGFSWLVGGLRCIFAWATVVGMVGLAQRYLNRPSAALRFLTEAVFPYYVLHQTIIVAVGFWLAEQALPLGIEVAIISITAIGGCVVLTEAIKAVPLLRPLFGLGRRSNGEKLPAPAPA
ncbi:glucans biosynthesis protein [Devosia sp. LC5]|nr:glucans biosynthesis protein [Devosia sp. LC5]